jgi:hypothetical protein
MTPRNQEAAPLVEDGCSAQDPNEVLSLKSTPTSELHWGESHRYCVSCGDERIDIDDHRCGSCLDDDVRFCPCCGQDIGALVNRDFARRFRKASNDVSEIWSEKRLTSRWAEWQRVIAARAKAGVR